MQSFSIFQNLESSASEVLQVQLKVFYENRDDDSDEFAQRFDNVRLELDDINECFELVKNMVMDTPAEPYFLSIFQVRKELRWNCKSSLFCSPWYWYCLDIILYHSA